MRRKRSGQPSARVTTSLNRPILLGSIFSALSSTTSMPTRLRLRITSLMKLAFFRCGSTSMTSFFGEMIFKGIPGNPAPLPTSKSRPVGLMKGAIASESIKWSLIMSVGVFIDVRLNREFQMRSNERYEENESICFWDSESPRYLVPSRRSSRPSPNPGSFCLLRKLLLLQID